MKKAFQLPETHPDFKLNQLHFDNEELANMAYSYVKEGEPFEADAGNFLLDWVNDKEHLELKTSGSTGAPKMIRIKKESMINSALATGKYFGLPEGTTALHCLPSTFIAGKMMLVRAMVLGWSIDLVQPKANPLEQVFKSYDFCAMTPFQLDYSLSRLHLIEKVIVGGGAVSANLDKLVQGIDSSIYETYGMTETVTHIAARHINPKEAAQKPIPFTVLPNVSVRLDERGCLVIEAPQLFDKPVVTNDVADLINEKQFLLKGRIDNVINSGGVKLHPEEIEKKLENIIGHRFFIGALPDDALGQKLVLVVEHPISEEAFQELKSAVENYRMLGKFEVPKDIFFVEKFEETPNGKVLRQDTLKKKIKSLE